jgi:hypothetical protein
MPDPTDRRAMTRKRSLHRNRNSCKKGKFATRARGGQAARKGHGSAVAKKSEVEEREGHLPQEVRQGETCTVCALKWLRHKIHHTRLFFEDFEVPLALQVLETNWLLR